MPEQPKSLTARTITGATWSAIGGLGQQVLSLVGTTVLARLLTPVDYGLVGMVSPVIGFILIFRDLGTSAAIVQRPELREEFVSTLFWVNLLFGVGAFLTAATLAPWVAVFYQTPTLTPVMRALSLSFVMSSFGIVPSGLLSRQLAFRRIVVAEVACAAAGLVVAITMATLDYGVWSLIAANLTNVTLESVLFLSFSRWRPRWTFDFDEIKRVYSFSANLVGFQVVNFFARNADNVLIGRYLGPASLGYYRLAYNLMLYPLQNVTGVLARVLFPALAQVQDDHPRFRRGYLQSCVAIAAITFPAMLGLMAVTGPFVEVLFGPKWKPVALLLAILAPVGLVQSVVSTVGLIYTAKGRTALMFLVALPVIVLTVASFVVGIRWGIEGVATAYAIVSLALALPILRIATNLIELPLSTVLKALAPVLGFSLVMLVPVTAVRLGLERVAALPPVLVLVPTVVLGVIVYTTTLFYWRPVFLRELLKTVGGLLPARFNGPVDRWVTR